jgi:HNH endonuclease
MSQHRKRAPRGLASWTLEQRFWRNVAKSDGCWLWIGATGNNGYGVMTRDGRRALVHRVSFEMHVAPIAQGQVVCHTCDVRSCVNPAHLFVGSIADNNRDMWTKGRGRGLDPHNGKLTNAQRRDAVVRVRNGETRSAVAEELGVTRQAITYLIKAGIYG